MRRLQDFEPFTNTLLRFLAKDTRFTCRPGLAKILAENSRLIVVFSHSSPLSWIPAPCLLTAHACARGGGSRVPIGIMDRFFYSLPGLSQLAGFISQSDRPLEFSALVDHFSALESADLVVFPEGSNCFFGPPDQIQEFRSARFVELAVRCKAPLLLAVHRGSEHWGLPVPYSPDTMKVLESSAGSVYQWLESYLKVEERASKTGLLTLPMLPKPMKRFDMFCELYHPQPKDLSRENVQHEAEKVRSRMVAMLKELQAEDEGLQSTTMPL